MLATFSSLRLKICIALLLIISTAIYLSQSSLGDHIIGPSDISHGPPSQKDIFIETALKSTVNRQFNNTAIKALCRNTTWTDGLIFRCSAPQGGLGNVENFVLTCVRFAIEAGAAFVIPKIMARSATDISKISTNDFRDFAHFFDTAHFKNTLATSCPQMKVYNSMDDLWNVPSAASPTILDPKELTTSLIHQRILAHPSDWRPAFIKELKSHTPRGFSAEAPITILLHKVQLEFPLSYDTQEFNQNFARIIRIREDIRRLAASILYELSSTTLPSIRPSVPIPKNSFLGVHLNAETNTPTYGYPDYTTQAKSYLELASIHNLSTIYVASGSPSNITRFASAAQILGRVTVSKETLLHGADLRALKELSWDQQALVDFEVLLRCSRFAGVMQSSFAWKVALRRHLLSRRTGYLTGVQALEDEFSVLYGSAGGVDFPVAMWP